MVQLDLVVLDNVMLDIDMWSGVGFVATGSNQLNKGLLKHKGMFIHDS